jgi:hypothetical protein
MSPTPPEAKELVRVVGFLCLVLLTSHGYTLGVISLSEALF